MVLVRHLWLMCTLFSVMFFLAWNTISHGQNEIDTFNLSGYVRHQNGLQVSTRFQIKSENQRLKTGWFQQETLTKVKTRKDGSYVISFLDIFGPNRTRVGDQIIVQVTADSEVGLSLIHI